MGIANPFHIAILAVLVLLVVGAKRLPEVGRSLGSGLRGFRESLGGEGAAPAIGHETAAAAVPALTAAAPVQPGSEPSPAAGDRAAAAAH